MKAVYRFLSRRIFLALSSILLISILVGVSVIIGHTQPSYASAPSIVETCALARTMEHCEQEDPEIQGCAADARTNAQANIDENGFTIGRVERRFSPTCRTWWGRVYDYRLGSQTNMFIGVDGTTLSASPTFVGDQYRILYSRMIFDPTLTRTVPQIVGTLTIDGIAPPINATIPAIPIPNK